MYVTTALLEIFLEPTEVFICFSAFALYMLLYNLSWVGAVTFSTVNRNRIYSLDYIWALLYLLAFYYIKIQRSDHYSGINIINATYFALLNILY